MKVKDLKEFINKLDDGLDIYINGTTPIGFYESDAYIDMYENLKPLENKESHPRYNKERNVYVDEEGNASPVFKCVLLKQQ